MDDNTNLNLGQKIKKFRKNAKLTQFELELKINASPGTVSRIESNQVNPTKETLSLIISALNLNIIESSSLFNVDVDSAISKMIDLTSVVGSSLDIKEITQSAIDVLDSLIGIDMVTVWLWDQNIRGLRLHGIRFPESIYELVVKITNFNLKKMVLLESNVKHCRNEYLKTLLTGEIIKTTDVYNLVYPFINKSVAKILQRWLGLEYILSIPLIYRGNKIGVWSFISMKDNVRKNEFVIIQKLANQIARSIYYAQKYEELEQKYLDLQTRYGG